ncbi:helicase [Branchiostoma belcheri]|nr:helicase [Branchiostoma belcheri]
MGEYGLALPWYEDALAVITHYPDVPLPCEFIYVLRARCCYEMCYQMKVDAYIQLGNIYKALETACDFYIHCPWNLEAVAMIGDLRREIEDKEREAKKHGDELIRKEEQQSKKRKTVCQQPPLVKKNRKKRREARTSGPGKRDASREAKKSSASSRESEASSHSTSDSEPQGLEEEDDSDQAAWAMVGKGPPIVTHNRFEITPPVVRSKQKSKAETRTKRKNVSPKPTTNVPRADPPSKHVREFPPMMIRKPQSRMGFPKREQPSPSLLIQATTRPERHSMAATVRGAEKLPPKRLFPTCLEDINKGNTALEEAKCYHCQLQCNSKQQLQKHYQTGCGSIGDRRLACLLDNTKCAPMDLGKLGSFLP